MSWAKITTPEPANFEDIMNEEVAKDMQAKEDKKLAEMVAVALEKDVSDYTQVPLNLVEDTCNSDEIIARMLQRQFDEEYDEMLKRTENKYNGASKVSVSFSNYRRAPKHADFESESDDEEPLEDPSEKRDWDRFDIVEREFNIMPACGYRVQQDGTMITKHDITMSGRRNACKMMNFPPDFHTGDGAGFDLQMSNKVFNSLRRYSSKEQARRHRLKDKKEDHATAEFGVDENTRLLLYKMINNQLLESVNGVISIGKEAVILHADVDHSDPSNTLPNECVIKVFKTILSEFKHRDKYIRDDYRFKDRMGKQSIRRTIHLWAEKEMHNLNRLKRAGIPCPEVITLKKHVLVMSFIGRDHNPAPKLKDAVMDEDQYAAAYNQVVNCMNILYHKARLIHADLSEYNILWYNNICYFIDVSQSTEPGHAGAFQFLIRDCENISNFFKRKGVPDVKTAEELFFDITGCDFSDKLALSALQNKFKMKPHLVDRADVEVIDDFEDIWQKSQTGVLTKAVQAQVEEPVVPLVDPPTA